MKWLFKILRDARFSYEPLVEVNIYKNRLLSNLNFFKTQYKDKKIVPVLKSNAYGHGLVQIAKILDREDLAFFVVDSYYEALVLKNEGIKTPILIIGYTKIENIIKNKLNNVSFTITGLEDINKISQNLCRPAKFHLKIDTGMHRQGILPGDLIETLSLIKKNKNIILDGVCTHLADANNINPDFTNAQISVWNDILFKNNELKNSKFKHISATAGSVYAKDSNSNIIRLGIGMYGISSNQEHIGHLKPVLEMNSIISGIKTINEKDFVGYGLTFKAFKTLKIATVPLGYFEGIDRRLSNKGSLKINNQFAPIAGAVSMNITTIDITGINNVKVGDSVNIISKESEDKNSVENISKICETIPYEILIHLPERLRRIVI